MKHLTVCFIVLAVALLALSSGVLAEQTCQITVREGMSIQAAISLALPGTVVCLEEGTWHENIVITKSLTLRGIGSREKTVIMAANKADSVIRVEGDQTIEVTIDGITVSWGPIGIAAVDAARMTVTNTTILFCGCGIGVAGAARGSVSNSSVSNCMTYGIYVINSAEAHVDTTEVANNEGWFAVRIEDSAGAVLTDSRITGNHYTGVSVGNRAHADIQDTVIEGNGKDGVEIGGSASITVIRSTVIKNKWRGIALGDSVHATLMDNRIAANGMYGVFLYERPCADTDLVFSGYLTGRANAITDLDEPEGNELGAVCPSTLLFLESAEGGELDRRQPHTN